MSLTGYKRADGRWGFRNHVLILPLHQMLSATAPLLSFSTSRAAEDNIWWSGRINTWFLKPHLPSALLYPVSSTTHSLPNVGQQSRQCQITHSLFFDHLQPY